VAHGVPDRLDQLAALGNALVPQIAEWLGTRILEWRALDAIVRPESGWNPCRVYPSRTDCLYAGSNSCGIPQANPCPAAWRGRLWATWRAQCDWIVAYIAARYGTPSAALAFRIMHHWY
jgi:hypothetical protein